jgi:hypothetical protein
LINLTINLEDSAGDYYAHVFQDRDGSWLVVYYSGLHEPVYPDGKERRLPPSPLSGPLLESIVAHLEGLRDMAVDEDRKAADAGERRPPHDWYHLYGRIVLAPDGWRGDALDFDTPLTYRQFAERADRSTTKGLRSSLAARVLGAIEEGEGVPPEQGETDDGL